MDSVDWTLQTTDYHHTIHNHILDEFMYSVTEHDRHMGAQMNCARVYHLFCAPPMVHFIHTRIHVVDVFCAKTCYPYYVDTYI
jgi:hypothetical protein